MALNMYYKNGMIRKTRCQISDDLVSTLYQVHTNAKFPQLTWLIDNLYENSQIQPDVAKALADEMVAFEKLILSLHLPFPMVPLQKMQTFFTEAATSKTRCQISDDLVSTLYQVHTNAKFPQLTWLIDNLYENSQIQPDIAKALADEMVAFEKLILSLHLPFPMVPLQKMQTFFTEAATNQQIIYTSSN